MAQNNLDTMMKNLQVRINAVKQGRIAMSGSLNGVHTPPAVLSHAWRHVSPDSRTDSEPTSRPVVSPALSATAVKRAGRPAANRSGLPALISRASSAPFTRLQLDDRHDCQSNVCREAQDNGLTGYRPGCGMVPADSRGK
jgi:hypothetical protein